LIRSAGLDYAPVMKAAHVPTSIAVVLTLLVGWTVFAAAFVHGPYSGAPSADSAVISWETDEPVPARVEYGPRGDFEATGALSEVVFVPVPREEGDNTTHTMLAELQPAAEYVYRVVLEEDEGEVASAVGSFYTAPDPGTSVSFAVLADTQWQTETTNPLELVGDAIASDPTPFQFVLHAGDVVESPSRPYWDHWFSSFDGMLLRAPFIPVLGNHEKNHRSYYETFCHPPGGGLYEERWWALHWGDVVVVGLDTNVTKAADYLAQQDWARAHLSGPEPHKFVLFHHPVFSSDAYHTDGYFLDTIYHPIFVETGVDIVFNGHCHLYERVARDGVTYLVVGGGGADPSEARPERVEGSLILAERHYFYTRVKTTPDRIYVETISVAEPKPDDALVPTGGVLDAFALPDEGAPTGGSTGWRSALLVAIGMVAAVWLLLRVLAD